MELLLLAITVVSLLAALVTTAAAWRLSREQRARSAARVAALAAAASDSPAGRAAFADAQNPSTPAPALALSTQAEETPNATAPSAHEVERRTLRPRAHAGTVLAPWSSPRSIPGRTAQPRTAVENLPPAAPLGEAFLGSAVAKPAGSERQRGLAIAAAVLFVAVVIGGYLTIYVGDSSTIDGTTAASASSPLELVSLRHERRGTRLSITGLVRNPSGGAPLDRIATVVFLFDQQGRFVTSARADVDYTRLTPGDESPFVVSLDAPSTVARYRVSFRSDAGVIAHVDRREQEPIARELP